MGMSKPTVADVREISDVRLEHHTLNEVSWVTMSDEPNSWPEVLITGELLLNEETGCLELFNEDDNEIPRVGIVWPKGTTVVDAQGSPTVVLADGTQIQIGERISAGGGTLSSRQVTENLGSSPTCSMRVFATFSVNSLMTPSTQEN